MQKITFWSCHEFVLLENCTASLLCSGIRRSVSDGGSGSDVMLSGLDEDPARRTGIMNRSLSGVILRRDENGAINLR